MKCWVDCAEDMQRAGMWHHNWQNDDSLQEIAGDSSQRMELVADTRLTMSTYHYHHHHNYHQMLFLMLTIWLSSNIR